MKKLLSVKQAIVYIRESFFNATIVKVWDDLETTEILFQWQGKRFELLSNTDIFFNDNNLFVIYEV